MKITNLSLVAAMLIGVSASANNDKLSDVIQNVKVSGTGIYRYNDYENSGAVNYFKIGADIKVNLNDEMSFNTRFIAGEDTKPVAFDTSSSSDKNVEFTMSELNLVYKGIENTTVKLGKTSIPTPFTVQRSSTGDEQVGTGITVNTKLGNITLNAGYFNQTNFDTSGNIKSYYTSKAGANFAFVGFKTSMGNTTLDATYAQAKDIFDVYTIGLENDVKVGDSTLSSFARYTSQDFDSENFTNTLWKAGAQLKYDIYKAFIAYGQTGKDGGTVGVDEGATTGFDEHWRVTLTGTKDASTVYASFKAQVTPKLNLGVYYSDLQADLSDDKNEIYAKASYDMYSDLNAYLMFGEYDRQGDETSTIGRVNITYKF